MNHQITPDDVTPRSIKRGGYTATNCKAQQSFMLRCEAEEWLDHQGSGKITNSFGEVVYVLTKGGRELSLAGAATRRHCFVPPFVNDAGYPLDPRIGACTATPTESRRVHR